MSYPQYPGASAEFDSRQPPASAYAYQDIVKPARGLTVAAAGLAILLTILELVEVRLAFAAQDEYLRAAADGRDAIDVFTGYDVIAIPWMFVLIAAYVVTCLWLYQARTNAEVLRPEVHHARSRGWVWGGWVVPFVNLWFPYQVVRDIVKGADRPTPMLGWWWASWVVYSITSQIGGRIVGFGEIDPTAVRALGTVEAVSAVFCVVAVTLWLLIIRRVVQDQERSRTDGAQS